MIKIENTPNLTGVKISGDFHDMYELVDAFHTIAVYEDSEKHQEYFQMSTRVLGLCYDIRHAYMGHRDVELVDNSCTDELKQWHKIKIPEKNLYYSCNCLYPEMFFIMLAINILIELRAQDLSMIRYPRENILHKKVIWDKPIALMRLLQAEFARCVSDTMAPGAFDRWMTLMNRNDLEIELMMDQYLDVLNIQYIRLSKQNKAKKLSSYAKRIAQFQKDKEFHEIYKVVMEAAEEYNCHPSDIQLTGIDYPDIITW